jgi:hypothetical protein
MPNTLWLPPAPPLPVTKSQFRQVGVFTPTVAIFPELEPNIETLERLLKQLSRTDALFCAARLNLVLSNPTYHSRINKQRYCVNNFFFKEDITRINEFVAARQDPESVFVF